MIKRIASEKQVPSSKLVEAIHRYQNNADKIYKLEDMDTEDVIRISYTLKYNLLEWMSKKYLSHLHSTGTGSEQEIYTLSLDMRTKQFTITGNTRNCDFLKGLHFGDCFRKTAQKNGWSSKYLETKLNYSQSTISELFKSKSLKVKKLFRISNLLRYNWVEEVYLSKICIVPFHHFEECIITLTDWQVFITKPDDSTFSMKYCRQGDE